MKHLKLFEEFENAASYYKTIAKWWDDMSDDDHWKLIENPDHDGIDGIGKVFGHQKYGTQRQAGKIAIQKLYQLRGDTLAKELGIH